MALFPALAPQEPVPPAAEAVPAAPPVQPPAEGQQMGDPMYGRTMLGSIVSAGGQAGRFARRVGVPVGDFPERMDVLQQSIEPNPDRSFPADVARGIAGLPFFPLLAVGTAEQAAAAAEKGGASPGEALAVGTGVGAVSGALDAVLPIGLGRVLKEGAEVGAKAIFKGLLKGATIEGGTEAVQQVAQNAVPAYYEGDPSKLTEGVGRAASVGAVVGGLAGGGATGVAGQPVAETPAVPPRGAGRPPGPPGPDATGSPVAPVAAPEPAGAPVAEPGASAPQSLRDLVLGEYRGKSAQEVHAALRASGRIPETMSLDQFVAEVNRRPQAVPAEPVRPVVESLPPPKAEPFQPEPGVYYHGSGTKGLTGEALDASMTKVDNLFGSGIYLTDNPEIAAGYAKARSKRTGTPTIYRTELGDVNLLDLEAPPPKGVPEVFLETAKALDDQFGTDDLVSDLQRIFDEGGSTEKAYARLGEEMGAISHGEQIPDYEFGEILDQMVIDPLRKLGYDGFTHTGGKRTGKAPHKVAIIFDPQDLGSVGRKPEFRNFAEWAPPAKPVPPTAAVPDTSTAVETATTASSPPTPVVAEPAAPADLPAVGGQAGAPGIVAPSPGAPKSTGGVTASPPGTGGASENSSPVALRRGGPWSTPLIDRVERQGGPVGREIATLARLASDTAGELRGKWQVATKGLRAALRGLTPTQRSVRNELNGRTEVVAEDTTGPLASYGFSKFQQAVEKDPVLETLTPAARRLVEQFRGFMQTMGADIESLRTPQGGPVLMETSHGMVPFRGAEGGKRLIRQWTPEMWQIMQAGDQSQAYRALAQALGEANGMGSEAALKTLNGIRETVVERRSAAEVARQFKEFPTFMRMRDGTEVPLLFADPMQSATAIVNNLATRMGYVSKFGQDSPNRSVGDRLREDFVRAGGEQADIDNVMRALQGMPVDDPSATLRPGTRAYEAARVADAGRTVGNAALLTRAFVPNISESVSKTPVVAGPVRAAKGYAAVLRMVVDPTFRESALADIERRGWHTIDMVDLMLTPGRKMESAARMVADALHLPAAKVNEMNDVHAAMTARAMLRDLEAGKGTAMDRERLGLLQFTPSQIETIMAGNPTPETAPLFNAVGRRLVSYSQGSTSLPAEMSRAANSRGYQRVVAFDRYAQFTANRFVRQIQGVFASGVDAASRARRATLLGQSILGHTASGSAAVLLGSLLKDGLVGLKDQIRGATAGDDEKEKAESMRVFLRDAAAYAILGGAADTLYDAATAGDSGSMFKRIGSGTVPGRYAAEFIDWYNSAGRYKAKSSTEAALEFLERNAPIAPVFRQAAVELGLGGKDPQREVAIRRAWEFIAKNQGVGLSGTATEPLDPKAYEKDREFRIAMKRVESAIRKGNTADLPALRSAARKAAGVAGKDYTKSLAGRTIISKIRVDNQKAAREWMGEDNWKALEQYDRLLKSGSR